MTCGRADGFDTGSMSATGIARAVQSGACPASGVLMDHIRRHEASAARLNALVQTRHREAVTEAAAVDAAIVSGAAVLPLAGVPVSVKECFPVRGLVTTLGLPGRRGIVDSADAAIVQRLRSAGAVVVGKANVPQAMYLHETDNPVWGRTLHPADPTRGPGGSSGGDAAAVAAGVVPLAVGNDLAGSLRQPANACGIATIVPRSEVLGEGGAFDTLPNLVAIRPRAGFLARTVDDLTLALRGVSALDAAGVTPTLRRVAWWEDAGPIRPSPAVRRAVREAVGRLSRQGVETVPVSGGLADEAAWLLLALVSADGGDDVQRLYRERGDRPIAGVAKLLAFAGMPRPWRPLTAAIAFALGSRIEAEGVRRTGRRTAAECAGLLATRDALRERFASLVAGCDGIVCPVSAVPALRHGTAARLLLAAAPCLLANLLDLPAGAVPVTTVRPEEEGARSWSVDPVLRAAAATDRDSAGLPVGVQVIGCPGRGEATVLEIMRRIEGEATPSSGPR